jgi:glycosyltransferase involved in cell wall biosynthesis
MDKSKPTITALTPTYNRSHTLMACFASLMNQTDKDFQWLIVDDGSQDETSKIVEEMSKQANFKISYLYKENGGKHTAVNRGLKEIDTELTFILDSDDVLNSHAIEIIKKEWTKYKKIPKIGGLCFLRGYNQDKPLGKFFPKNHWVANGIMLENAGVSQDKFEVIRTYVLKEFPFPEISGERFIAESIVWIPLAHKYNLVFINEILYITEYLEGGLTKTGRVLRFQYPKGASLTAKERLSHLFKYRIRIKNAWLYICYSFFFEKKLTTIFKDSGYPIFIFFNLPFGFILYQYWQYRHKNKVK